MPYSDMTSLNVSHSHKQEMYKMIADVFEKIGAEDDRYSETQKTSDCQEVLSTLLAFSIYNSCPTPKAIKRVKKQVFKLHRWV